MSQWGKRDDMLLHEADPYNAEPPPDGLADALLTPLDSFYSRNHGPVPQLDPGSWRLTVDGLVERPLRLSLADLRAAHPTRTVLATLQCAGNRRAGLLEVRDIPGEDPWGPAATSTAEWTGVSLGDVLAEAGVKDTARHVAFEAPDVSQLADPPQPFGASVPLDKAASAEVLLAWEMNGQPLPVVHGAPLRVVVPGWIGARSVKWLQRVTVMPRPSSNYFQASAYRLLPADAGPDAVGPGVGVSLGPVALNSAVLRPADGAVLPAGPTHVTGYAFAGESRSVARVDVSLDDGRSWTQADLDAPAGPWAWQLWRTTLDLPAGDTAVTVRAWDSSAALQPASPEHVWNPKGYVNNSWHRVRVTVR